MEQKEFEESIVRITDTMKVSVPAIRDRIVEEEALDTQPYVVNATIVSVIVEPEEKSLQVMQAFLSEASNIYDLFHTILTSALEDGYNYYLYFAE